MLNDVEKLKIRTINVRIYDKQNSVCFKRLRFCYIA